MNRSDSLARLRDGPPLDALIVGGGITGAGVALEFARTGLRVGLVEARDYASGTSSRSSKLVHGGLRYLAQGDIRLTRESVRDRTELLRAAPGLVKPLGFLLPVRAGDKYGRLVLGLGLAAYDFFAGARTRRWHDAESLLAEAPVLSPKGLKGGWSYLDAETDDARLVLRVLAEARRRGALTVNRIAAESLTLGANGVDGARLHDVVEGVSFEVKARCVINAAGAWSDRLRAEVGGEPKLRPLRGSHLLFEAWRFPLAQAVALFHPDDRRPLFAVPWEGSTLIGTTDVDHRDDLDREPGITRAEFDYILKAARSEFPNLELAEADVVSTWSGVRPVIASGSNVDPSKETRDSLILEEKGLITVTGGKLTTFRSTALAAMRHAADRLPELKREHRGDAALLCAVGRDDRGPARRAARAQRALARPVRRRCDRSAAVRRRGRVADDPPYRRGLGGAALGLPLRAGRPPRRSHAAPDAPRTPAARRRRGAPAAGEGNRRERTRLERQPLERGGRGISGSDRPLLRDPRNAPMTASGDELVLAIDCGTQSVRALVVDLEGTILAKSQQALEAYSVAQEGWLEHDAEAFWTASAAVCRGVVAERPDLKARVKGMAVTTQRGSLTLVDQSGKPLRPFIIWLDQRRAHRTPPIPAWWRLAFMAAGVGGTVDHLAREAELNWIAEHEPERLEGAHKALLVSGWLNYRLTGRFVDSVASQVGYLPFDFKRQTWARSWDWKWSALGARRDQMPELAPVGSILGGLTKEAAEATGLAEGLPVVAAAADKACEILGAGAITPDVGAVSYGTTATINVTTPRYLESTPFIPPYPAALPGQFAVEIQIFRGFWMVSWFKQQFGHPEVAAAPARGRFAGGFVRPAGQGRAARQPGPDAAALLDAGRPQPRPGRPRRRDRLHRHAHARPPLSRHSRGARLRAARRRRTHSEAKQDPDHQPARLRRRLPIGRRHADDRRHLQPARLASPYVRDGGPRRGDRGRRRARPAPGFSVRRRRDDASRRDLRARSDERRAL